MSEQQIAFVTIVSLAVVVLALDRRMRRKAKNVRTSWNCIRCGIQLGPMQSEMIRVAGGPEGPGVLARACIRCARREKRVWWTVVALVAVGFLATLMLLKLNEG